MNKRTAKIKSFYILLSMTMMFTLTARTSQGTAGETAVSGAAFVDEKLLNIERKEKNEVYDEIEMVDGLNNTNVNDLLYKDDFLFIVESIKNIEDTNDLVKTVFNESPGDNKILYDDENKNGSVILENEKELNGIDKPFDPDEIKNNDESINLNISNNKDESNENNELINTNESNETNDTTTPDSTNETENTPSTEEPNEEDVTTTPESTNEDDDTPTSDEPNEEDDTPTSDEPIEDDDTPPDESNETVTDVPDPHELYSYSINASGSISGYIRAEDGSRSSGSNDQSSEVIIPLADYSVYLYQAGETEEPVAETRTGADGAYTFDGFMPGGYFAGILSETIDGRDYLLPFDITDENFFVMDAEHIPLTAFTELIEIAENESVTDINALLRLPAVVRAAPAHIIQIGTGALSNGVYDGYTLGGAANARVLTFNVASGFNKYEIIQAGSSQFTNIVFENNVKTTVILNGVALINGDAADSIFRMELKDGAEITLLLAGTNIINTGHITVYSNSTLIIDSALSPGGESGELKLTTGFAFYAGIGGKGDAQDKYNGKIIIDGGTVEVTRRTGTDSAPTAAAIGGGNKESGHVTINGGVVNASNISESTNHFIGGAAIGGGDSAATRSEVYINGGVVTAAAAIGRPDIRYGGGAAIGGGANSTKTTVLINGGYINATAAYGAAIGGGYHSPGDVTINAGVITADSARGASVGNGVSSSGGSVKITGGDILAFNLEGAGIGAGNSSGAPPTYEICHNAKIIVIGRSLSSSNNMGIKGDGKNLGDAYFVNLYYKNYTSTIVSVNHIVVMEKKTDSVIWDLQVDEAHEKIVTFSFSTGLTERAEYVVYMDYGQGLAPIVRYDSDKNNVPNIIYSVNEMKGYKVHEYVNAVDFILRDGLPYITKNVGGSGFIFVVTEKCVDIYGTDIAGVPPRTIMKPRGSYYDTPPRVIPGYSPVGFKPDNRPGGGGDYTPLPFAANPAAIIKDTDFYIVYKKDGASLTVSKEVRGGGDLAKEFAFTAYFYGDASGAPLISDANITCKIIDGLKNIIDEPIFTDNVIDFNLRHGDRMIFDGAPIGSWVVIEEAQAVFYETSFMDSETPGQTEYGVTTGGPRVITSDRAFEFVNTKMYIVPTRVDSGDVKTVLALPVSLIALIAVTMFIIPALRRRFASRLNFYRPT